MPTTLSDVQPMVVSLALNPAVDHTIDVPGIRFGSVNRALSMHIDIGGKGVNVASCLADFGIPTAVMGILGRDNSTMFENLFRRKRIANHCFYEDGMTRINVKLHDPVRGDTTDLNMPGPSYTSESASALVHQLIARFEQITAGAKLVVMSGSLPPGFAVDTYASLIAPLRAAGRQVFLDTSGEPLVAALQAGPHMIKPNRQELSNLVNRPLGSLDEILAAAREVLARPSAPDTVVVSMGGQGALFATRDEALHAYALPVHVGSTVGAGDAMVAGFAAAKLRNLSLSEAAKIATAFAAAKLTRFGPHLPSIDEVRALSEKVILHTIE